MGQLESCLRDGKDRDLQGPIEHEQPSSFNVRPVSLLPGDSNQVVGVHAPSQYSSLLAKLKHYDKNQLAKVLVSEPLPQIHARSLERQARKGRGTPPSLKDSGHSVRQDNEMRQLEALKQECNRIDHLRSQLIRKSRRMQEQEGSKNQVHSHQSMFASTRKPQSPSPSPRR